MTSTNSTTTKHLLLYVLILIIVCIGVWYFMSVRTYSILIVPVNTSIISETSSNIFCYPPNSTAFRYDKLRELVITNLVNKSAYVNETDAFKITYISNNYSTLIEFIHNCRAAQMSRRLIPEGKTIELIFRNPPLKHMVRPPCDGLWVEFGVFRGGTLTMMANWKKIYCSNNNQPVYGFDTFSGLPTDWRSGYQRGSFSADEKSISVPSNVILVKGLFIDTLPNQLRLIDQQYRCYTPVSFIHIDCDIYDGARDILFLLGNRLVSGSIIVFDELFNYPSYEKHEIRALFEFLVASKPNMRLIPLGSFNNIDLNTTSDILPNSFGFLVHIDETL